MHRMGSARQSSCAAQLTRDRAPCAGWKAIVSPPVIIGAVARYEQRFAAVCGNGHVETNFLQYPGVAGNDGIPRLCRKCSAPIYTKCDSCSEPIYGHRSYRLYALKAGGV